MVHSLPITITGRSAVHAVVVVVLSFSLQANKGVYTVTLL